jgi:membrane protease YdiL (CAAX protease family)
MMLSTAALERLELALALILGAANVASEAVPGTKAPLVVVGVAAWAVLVAAHLRADPGAWRRWGFRADNLAVSATLVALWTVPLLVAFTLWGAVAGRFPPPPGFLAIVALYPAWGIAQQFLLQAIVWTTLARRLPRAVAQVIAAALFALSHVPDWPVVALALPVGVLTIELYRRRPNLWVLGTAHGLLGTFAFYFMLGRDPLAGLLGVAP